MVGDEPRKTLGECTGMPTRIHEILASALRNLLLMPEKQRTGASVPRL